MGKLADLVGKLQGISQAVQIQAMLAIIKSNQSIILDLETSRLFRGVDSDGNVLMPYKNAKYALFKETLNPAGVTDLKLTGAFYDGFYMDADIFPITFWSNDIKTQTLVEIYGKSIFGIDANGIKELADQIREQVGEYYRDLFSV